MTQRLEHALAALRKRPEPDHDAIASMILDQLAGDRAWDHSFANSQDQLSRLAAEARNDIAAGRVRALKPWRKP